MNHHPTPSSSPMSDRYACPNCGEVDCVQLEAARQKYIYANDEHAEAEDSSCTGYEYDAARHGARCNRCGASTWTDTPPKPETHGNPESGELWRRQCTYEEALVDCAEDIRQAECLSVAKLREYVSCDEISKRWPGIAPLVIGAELSAALKTLIGERE
jgi:hypothetical protein